MECLSQKNEPVVSVQFLCKNHKQKMLIHALLKCSKLSLEGIATILKVPYNLIVNVYNGDCYLRSKQAVELAQLFIICFTD